VGGCLSFQQIPRDPLTEGGNNSASCGLFSFAGKGKGNEDRKDEVQGRKEHPKTGKKLFYFHGGVQREGRRLHPQKRERICNPEWKVTRVSLKNFSADPGRRFGAADLKSAQTVLREKMGGKTKL